MNDLYTKQEISQLLHVSYKTLRGYEDKGLIVPYYVNTENGYKYYDGNQIYTIDLIRYCNQDLDIPLTKIKDLLGENNHKEKLISFLQEKKSNAEAMVQKYQKIVENIEHSLAFNTLPIEKETPYISYEDQIFYYRNVDSLTVYSDARKVAQQIYELLESNSLNFVFNKSSIDINDINKIGIFCKKKNPTAETEMQKDCFQGKYLCILYNDYVERSEKALIKLLEYALENNIKLDTTSYYFEFQSMDISITKVEDALVILKIKILE